MTRPPVHLTRRHLLAGIGVAAEALAGKASLAAFALADIIRAIEGREERRCLLGHGRCGNNPSCTAHARWAPIANQMDAFFGKTTLADLLHQPLPH